MTSLRFGLSVCVAGLLAATGCPAEEEDDTGGTEGVATDDATDTTPATDTMPASEESTVAAEESTGSGTAPSHAADIQPIWDEHCVDACHEPGGQWGTFLDLSGDAYAAIVNVPSPQFMDLDHIEPNDPDRSYIWHKINGTQVMAGGSGVMMPSPRPGMDPTVLTPEQIATIEAWINGGAQP